MEKHMQIYLNGELTQTACHNLLQLVQELALEGKRFAVEQNEQIVPKSKLEQSPFQIMIVSKLFTLLAAAKRSKPCKIHL
jgi:sulfur carrier protein